MWPEGDRRSLFYSISEKGKRTPTHTYPVILEQVIMLVYLLTEAPIHNESSGFTMRMYSCTFLLWQTLSICKWIFRNSWM